MSSSSSLQQVQSLCARSNPFLDHKGSISSTSTWRRGSSTRRSLLLRVCVHPQYHCTHQRTFAGCCTSSQSAPDTNRDDIQRSRQIPWKSEREIVAGVLHNGGITDQKANERYPDFKHKKTGEALWLEDGRNPPWVAER